MNAGYSSNKSCLGKPQYADAGNARRAKPFLAYGKTLVPYECVYCRFWHLGHSGRNAEGRRARRRTR